jgi:hypothetical protein|tara:strand:- start:783 stop:1133 length:351 start_codon:yes stop_codon:yes gene_type:complete
MPEDTKQVTDPNYVNVDKLVKGALGDKPFEVKGAFDDEMLSRVSQVIAGKRDAVHKNMFGDQEMGAEIESDEDVLDKELTDDEIEDALNDEAPEEQEEAPEEEPEEVENEEPNETT